MFINQEIWRAQVFADRLLDMPDPNDDVYDCLTPAIYHGFDREGRPLYFERTGAIKLKDVFPVLTDEQLVARHIRHHEKQRVRQLGFRDEWHYREYLTAKENGADLSSYPDPSLEPAVETQTVIMDLSGLSMKPDNRGMAVFKATLKMDADMYPESLGHFFILNAPWIFKPLWGVIKYWLDPTTRKKFHVLGSDYYETLVQYIDPSQIPAELGGECRCYADGLCCGKVGEWPEGEPDRWSVGPGSEGWTPPPRPPAQPRVHFAPRPSEREHSAKRPTAAAAASSSSSDWGSDWSHDQAAGKPQGIVRGASALASSSIAQDSVRNASVRAPVHAPAQAHESPNGRTAHDSGRPRRRQRPARETHRPRSSDEGDDIFYSCE